MTREGEDKRAGIAHTWASYNENYLESVLHSVNQVLRPSSVTMQTFKLYHSSNKFTSKKIERLRYKMANKNMGWESSRPVAPLLQLISDLPKILSRVRSCNQQVKTTLTAWMRTNNKFLKIICDSEIRFLSFILS